MEALETVLLVLLVADAIGLSVLVLMQQGKGAEVGAAFGSGSANTVFGSAGAGSFLTKLTVWLAVGFFVIAFGLAYTAKQRAMDTSIEGLPVVPPVMNESPKDASGESSSENKNVPSSEGSELTPETESVDSGLPDV